jgi:hypothetical protein
MPAPTEYAWSGPRPQLRCMLGFASGAGRVNVLSGQLNFQDAPFHRRIRVFPVVKW